MWWQKLFGSATKRKAEAPAEWRPTGYPEARAPHERRGLGEASRPAQFAGRRGPDPAAPNTLVPGCIPGGVPDGPDPAALPFPSTGPHGHRGRMRDKLLERGPDALADYELLEMLLFFAMPKGDTKPLAKALINRFGSFGNVLAAPNHILLDTRGLGPHSVAALKLVQATALRMMRADVLEQPVLNNWDRLMDYLTAALAREKVEQFRVLYLDTKNRLIADEAQARGTVNHTPVYPREVVKRALELHATALIMVHNHPSGDTKPSMPDVSMTQEVKHAAAVFSISLHDHLIIGNGGWFSFRDAGIL